MNIALLIRRLRRHIVEAQATKRYDLVADLRAAVTVLERSERERVFAPRPKAREGAAIS
jgi:hypothetical protein